MQVIPLSLMNSEYSTDKKPLNKNNDYIPGQCNIGSEEIENRKRKAIGGLVITSLCIAALQIFNLPHIWRFLILIPLSYSILCYYQAQNKFCVAFGIIGIYNFLEIGKSTKIAKTEYKTKDKRNAWLIIVKSFLLALLIVFIYYLLPV